MSYNKIEKISWTQIYLGELNVSLAMSVTFQKFHFLSYSQATGNNLAISGSPRPEKP